MDAKTIAELREELRVANAHAADADAKLARLSATAAAAAAASQDDSHSASSVQEKGAVATTPSGTARRWEGAESEAERDRERQKEAARDRESCAAHGLLDGNGELTDHAREIFTGWFLAAINTNSSSTSSSDQLAPGSAGGSEGGDGDDDEGTNFGLLGRADAARLFSRVTGVTLSSSSLPIERLFGEYCKGSAASQQHEHKEGLRLSEYLAFYRQACRQQGPLVWESIHRMKGSVAQLVRPSATAESRGTAAAAAQDDSSSGY